MLSSTPVAVSAPSVVTVVTFLLFSSAGLLLSFFVFGGGLAKSALIAAFCFAFSSCSSAASALPDGSPPPINVLIVEDNVINLKLLEAFMKRLKVRWKSAMNGKEAVAMWRQGGFHLVLMDIQLPVMNGLEATKEIRRLEGVNGIGVFSVNPIAGATKNQSQKSEDDELPDKKLFKSPVIIVALTASSLQSDRHEALAAGCNDFLTKVRLRKALPLEPTYVLHLYCPP
jgi:CheY-like chemotaxis protein